MQQMAKRSSIIRRTTVDTSDEESVQDNEERPAAKKMKSSKDTSAQEHAACNKLSAATLHETQRRRLGRMRHAPGAAGGASSDAPLPAPMEQPTDTSSTSNESLLRGLPSPLNRATATEQERVITEFVRFHPMCSAIGGSVLQQIANMVERVPVRVPELAIVGKSYEDEQLRPAMHELGERSCVSGDECLCNFIARLRYGSPNPYGFTGVEFLLPAQRERWLAGHGLPSNQGKCLVCLRYWTTRLYLIARSDPSFRLGVCGKFMMQTHTNPVLERNEGRPIQKALDGTQELPTHVNTVNCVDGYIPDAMLYADEEFVNCHASREGNSAAFTWKPVVRFDSSHYRYVADKDGLSRIVQVGIGMDLNCLPPSTASRSMAANPTRTPMITAKKKKKKWNTTGSSSSSSRGSVMESDTTATLPAVSSLAA